MGQCVLGQWVIGQQVNGSVSQKNHHIQPGYNYMGHRHVFITHLPIHRCHVDAFIFLCIRNVGIYQHHHS